MTSIISLISSRVFEIPELVLEVLRMLSISDRARLLRVNKLFFQQGAFQVWRNVRGVEAIFAMLLGTEISSLDIANHWVNMDPAHAEANMARFNIYAAMIQRIHILRRPTQGYLWMELGDLSGYNLLLPNLREVVLSRVNNEQQSRMLPVILRHFCGPSCVIIRADSTDLGTPWIRQEDSIAALRLLTLHAEHLCHLDFFVKAKHLSKKHLTLLASTLSSALQLNQLGLGHYSLSNEVLNAAGHLPNLKNLTFLFDSRADISNSGLHIPEGCFHGLSRLVVRGAKPRQLLCLMTLRPLIAGVCATELDVSEGDQSSRPLENVFRLLADGAPRLQDLELKFQPNGHHVYIVRSDRLMPLLSSISLRRLELHNVCLSDQQLTKWIEGCFTWFPTLTHFIMPQQPASLQDIPIFAKFSELQVLSVDLMCMKIPSDTQSDIRSCGRTLRIESYFHNQLLLPSQVSSIARFMLEYWEDVDVVFTRKTLRWHDAQDLLDYWVYHGLTKEIAALKGKEPSFCTVELR